MKVSALKYNIIYIFGPDGSGKSTICKELVKLLNKKGVRATFRWMRFNHYFSKCVNAIGHIMGLSYYKKYPDGTEIGYHHYYKSRFLSKAYCLSTILDTVVALVFKLWLPSLVTRRIFVVDRFVFDTIVDLAIDTGNPDLLLNFEGILLKRLLLPKTIFIYLNVDKDTIFRRRPDTRWDENFNIRKEMYEKICILYANSWGVNNNGAIEPTLRKIVKLIQT